LGGLGEIGKNITVFEYGSDIICEDLGSIFPREDMPGIDLVIPDITYLEKNRDKIRGFVITHGHEDHIGASPYILKELRFPVYGSRIALALIENKLKEHRLADKVELNVIQPGDTVKLGVFQVEFIKVNHSIAGACALAIHTPVGVVVHTGDFKVDYTPIDGAPIDLAFPFPNHNIGTTLLDVSLSPDVVEDRGHTFGSELSEDDRRALVEYLKTL
jgi:ribonuclease J